MLLIQSESLTDAIEIDPFHPSSVFLGKHDRPYSGLCEDNVAAALPVQRPTERLQQDLHIGKASPWGPCPNLLDQPLKPGHPNTPMVLYTVPSPNKSTTATSLYLGTDVNGREIVTSEG